jgi:hypothetical protein
MANRREAWWPRKGFPRRLAARSRSASGRSQLDGRFPEFLRGGTDPRFSESRLHLAPRSQAVPQGRDDLQEPSGEREFPAISCRSRRTLPRGSSLTTGRTSQSLAKRLCASSRTLTELGRRVRLCTHEGRNGLPGRLTHCVVTGIELTSAKDGDISRRRRHPAGSGTACSRWPATVCYFL